MTFENRTDSWFLITDIQGSTGKWERYRSEMPSALAEHDGIISSAIASCGGTVFKHTGDGVIARFADPVLAVAAAVDAQLELAAHDFGAVDGLLVRIGIHGGEILQRGDDYFGSTLNRAARTMSAGHGGQILVSDEVRVADEGRLVVRGGDVTFVDLGLQRLAGFAEPARLHQVVHSLLPSEFPALRTLSLSAGNIPAQREALIGRSSELAALCDTLRSEDTVTLVGPGGVGKTALALHAARTVATEYADGTWFCDLSSIRRGSLVAPALLSALAIDRRTRQSEEATLRDVLASRQLLLIVDNCEHLIEEVRRVLVAMRPDASRSRILATSRVRIGVPGEVCVPLAPLATPGGRGGSVPLEESPAVQLFAERAAGVGYSADLDGADGAAIALICDELDGLPLAIELAAARTAVLSVEDIAVRLNQRLRLLVRRTSENDHHATMKATVAWSFQLLSEDEQDLIALIGVFEGGFELGGLVAVSQLDEFDALDHLQSLLDNSMLEAESTGARFRYRALEVVRDYSLERLPERHDERAVRRRHGEYYAGLVGDLTADLHTEAEPDLLDRLSIEMANIRRAFEGLAVDDPSRGAELLGQLWPLWVARGLVDEGIRLLQVIEPLLPAASMLRIAALEDLASLLWIAGETVATEFICRKAMDLASDLGARAPPIATSRLAIIRCLDGEQDAARTLLSALSDDIASVTSRPDRVRAAGLYGAAWSFCGDLDAGIEWCDLAVRIAEDEGPGSRSLALGNAALTYLFRDPNRARELAREGVVQSQLLRSPYGLANCLRSLAIAEQRCGNRDASLRACAGSLRFARETGMRTNAMAVLECMARQLHDRPVDAAVLYGAAGLIRFEMSSGGMAVEQKTRSTELLQLLEILGEESLVDALARGRDLGFDGIAAYAQALVDTIAFGAVPTP